jgi:hypothetical protein
MTTVVFIDTSILCNLIPVPGRNQDETQVRTELSSRLSSGHQFILPITSVIETGNFVAQLGDGRERLATATKFESILRLICAGNAPWVLHDVAWNQDFLELFLDGGGSGMNYVEHAQSRIGAGDLCILTEREHYRARTKIDAEVWTLDDGLNSHN